MGSTLLKSILHNVGVSAVSIAFALTGRGLDHLLHLAWGQHFAVLIVGGIAFLGGFVVRVWAAFHFYERQMRVIALSTQGHLVTTGPFRYSRNPLYLGGNVLMFLGASLLLATPSGVVLTFLHLPLVSLMIRREERQLEQAFGDEWREYEQRVRRWI